MPQTRVPPDEIDRLLVLANDYSHVELAAAWGNATASLVGKLRNGYRPKRMDDHRLEAMRKLVARLESVEKVTARDPIGSPGTPSLPQPLESLARVVMTEDRRAGSVSGRKPAPPYVIDTVASASGRAVLIAVGRLGFIKEMAAKISEMAGRSEEELAHSQGISRADRVAAAELAERTQAEHAQKAAKGLRQHSSGSRKKR